MELLIHLQKGDGSLRLKPLVTGESESEFFSIASKVHSDLTGCMKFCVGGVTGLPKPQENHAIIMVSVSQICHIGFRTSLHVSG